MNYMRSQIPFRVPLSYKKGTDLRRPTNKDSYKAARFLNGLNYALRFLSRNSQREKRNSVPQPWTLHHKIFLLDFLVCLELGHGTFEANAAVIDDIGPGDHLEG